MDLGHLTAFDPSAAATHDGEEAKAQATALTQVGVGAVWIWPLVTAIEAEALSNGSKLTERS